MANIRRGYNEKEGRNEERRRHKTTTEITTKKIRKRKRLLAALSWQKVLSNVTTTELVDLPKAHPVQDKQLAQRQVFLGKTRQSHL